MNSAVQIETPLRLLFSFESLMWKETVLSLLFWISFQFIWFFALRKAYPIMLGDPKNYSWIPTTTSSVLMTLSSLPYVFCYFKFESDFNQFPLMNDGFARFIICFFMSYLIADCTLGYLIYPQHMNYVTGYVSNFNSDQS